MSRKQPKPSWEIFGEQLKRCREGARPNTLLQRELAAKLDVDESLISKYEKGHVLPSWDRLEEIIEVFERVLVDSEEIRKLRETFPGPVPADPGVLNHDSVLRSFRRTLNHSELSLPGEQEAFLEDEDRLKVVWSLLLEARELRKKGKLDVAKDKLDRARAQFLLGGVRAETRIRAELAQLLKFEGKPDDALRQLRAAEAESLKSERGDFLMRADIIRQEGDICRRQGNWQMAEEKYRQSLSIYEMRRDRKRIADLERKIAGLRLRQGLLDEGLERSNKSIEICLQEDYREGYRKGLQLNAWGNALHGHYDEAIATEDEAIDLAIELGAPGHDLAKAYWYRGDYFLGAKRVEEAEAAYRKAEELLRKVLGQQGLNREVLIYPMVLHGLGSVFLEQGHHKEAENYLRKSQRLNLEAHDQYYEALNLRQIARLNRALLNYHEAETILNAAYGLVTNDDGPASMLQQSDILTDRATLSLERGAYLEASKHAEQAIAISQRHGYRPTRARARLALATTRVLKSDTHNELGEVLSLNLLAVKDTSGLHVSITTEIMQGIRAQLDTLIRKDRVDAALFLAEEIIETMPRRLGNSGSRTDKVLQTWVIEVEDFRLRLHAAMGTKQPDTAAR